MPKFQLIGADNATVDGEEVRRGGVITLTRAAFAALDTDVQEQFQQLGDVRVKTPLGFAQLAVSNTSVSLPTIPAAANLAVICVESGAVRWRDDGTDPTAAVGMLLPAGGTYEFDANLAEIEFIRTSVDAALSISYYEVT